MGVSPILGTPPFWWDLRNFEQISFVRFSYEGKAKEAVSSLLRIPPQNWGDVLNFERKIFQMCPKLDRPLRRI